MGKESFARPYLGSGQALAATGRSRRRPQRAPAPARQRPLSHGRASRWRRWRVEPADGAEACGAPSNVDTSAVTGASTALSGSQPGSGSPARTRPA